MIMFWLSLNVADRLHGWTTDVTASVVTSGDPKCTWMTIHYGTIQIVYCWPGTIAMDVYYAAGMHAI